MPIHRSWPRSSCAQERADPMKLLPILLAALLAQPTSPIECDPKHPNQCSMPIARGQISLLDGMVLTTELAIFLGQKADGVDALLKIQKEHLDKLHEADKALAVALVKADLTVATASAAAQRRQTDYWERRASSAEQRLSEGPPWYLHPALMVTYGVVVTTIIVAIVAAELHIVPGS